jgi:hypothetical protein
VHLLPGAYALNHGHRQATDPAHGRKADFLVVSRRSCLLVTEGVIVYGTHPMIPPTNQEVHRQHRDQRHAVTNKGGPGVYSSLLQQDPLQGLKELLCDPIGVTGSCEEVGILPKIPLYLRTNHSTLIWLLIFKNLERQIACWIQRPREYNFISKHCQRQKHTNADGPFRRLCPEAHTHCQKAGQSGSSELRVITATTTDGCGCAAVRKK